MGDLKIEEKITLERSLEKGTRFNVLCASQALFVIHVQGCTIFEINVLALCLILLFILTMNAEKHHSHGN
jgi:hypothetical protein